MSIVFNPLPKGFDRVGGDSSTLSGKTIDNTNTITVKDANLTLQDDADATKQAKFELSGITAGQTRTITLPDASLTLVGTDTTQTLTAKTIDNTNTLTVKDANLTLQDDADTTKQAKFELSGITAGQTRTITLPDASLTLVGTDTAQTLTAKTLTSPDINGGTWNGTIDGAWTAAGQTCANGGSVTTMDLNGGTVDGTTIGGSSAAAGTFTALAASTSIAGPGSFAVDSIGRQTMPTQPAFSAYLSAPTSTDKTGDGTQYTVIFDTEIFDQNANYNTATGVFTAPVTGRYQLNLNIAAANVVAGHTYGYMRIVTSNRTFVKAIGDPAMDAYGQVGWVLSVLADMDASDTAYATLEIGGSTKTIGAHGHATIPVTNFSGFLAC